MAESSENQEKSLSERAYTRVERGVVLAAAVEYLTQLYPPLGSSIHQWAVQLTWRFLDLFTQIIDGLGGSPVLVIPNFNEQLKDNRERVIGSLSRSFQSIAYILRPMVRIAALIVVIWTIVRRLF